MSKQKDDAKLKGDKASQLLRDPLLSEAIDEIRSSLYSKIENSSFKQRDEREDCYFMLRAVESFEGMLRKYINAGKTAASEERQSILNRSVTRVQDL